MEYLGLHNLINTIEKNKKRGLVIFSYMGLYSIARYFIEGLRTDSLWLGPFRVAQLVSLAGIFLWLAFLVYAKLKRKSSRLRTVAFSFASFLFSWRY